MKSLHLPATLGLAALALAAATIAIGTWLGFPAP